VGSGSRWKVATIRGIPLYVSASWLFIAALYVFAQFHTLSLEVGISDAEAITLSVLAAVLFFGSVLLHEGAHAVTARALDLPVTGITLVFWGGATETKASARGPKGEFLVAFVGPATTLAMAGVFWVLAQVASGALGRILHDLAWLSLIFAAVNALPGFPLDGGRMLLAGVWGATGARRTAMRVAGYAGIAIGVGMIAGAVWALNEGQDWWLFLGYLGFILIVTGRSMDQRIAFRDQLVRGTVADAMRAPGSTVPADITLLQALDTYLRGVERSFPVLDRDGRVVGTVSIETARRVGAHDPMRPVRDGMAPLAQTPVLRPDETLDDAVEWLAGRPGLVLHDGALVGEIGPNDVERWYRRVIEGRPVDAGVAAADQGGISPIPPRPDL
jgi:Zn-dependent protease